MANELDGLRTLLASLESGSMQIRHSGKDVTVEEIRKLKIDITSIERALARVKVGGAQAGTAPTLSEGKL